MPRVERVRSASDEFLAFWRFGLDKGRQGGNGGWRSGGKAQGRSRALLSARHTLPTHHLTHACARDTGACNMPWVQQRRCLRRTLRESSRERPDGDGAGGGSSEAGRVLTGEIAFYFSDRRQHVVTAGRGRRTPDARDRPMKCSC